MQLAWADRIDRINLYNRTDCCWQRLSNFRVSVFAGPVAILDAASNPVLVEIVR